MLLIFCQAHLSTFTLFCSFSKFPSVSAIIHKVIRSKRLSTCYLVVLVVCNSTCHCSFTSNWSCKELLLYSYTEFSLTCASNKLPSHLRLNTTAIICWLPKTMNISFQLSFNTAKYFFKNSTIACHFYRSWNECIIVIIVVHGY